MWSYKRRGQNGVKGLRFSEYGITVPKANSEREEHRCSVLSFKKEAYESLYGPPRKRKTDIDTSDYCFSGVIWTHFHKVWFYSVLMIKS